MKVLRNRAFRWVLLTLGLIAVIALTGMNVLTLYDLRDRMVEREQERRVDQMDEFNDRIRNEILQPVRGLYRIELEPIETSLEMYGQLPDNVHTVVSRSSKSPYFKNIYYVPENVNTCDTRDPIYRFDPELDKLNVTTEYPDLVCDGVGLARTKTKIQLNDFNYRWNNNFEFDTHRSLNVGLINLSESRLMGYLVLTLDQDYIIDEVFPPLLTYFFGKSEETGIVVWIRDGLNNEVLASNDTQIEYDRELVSHRLQFSGYGFFNNWVMYLAFLKSPVTYAYNETLVKNLIVLGVAVLFLLGALLFMFATAQRERSLAQRQANFLANVTHELKTPLAVMQAAGENISDGRVTETDRLKQYGEHIYQESIRLRSMIEKLLDVARADSDQNIVKALPYRLHDLVTEYLDENQSYLEKKGFTIEFQSKDQEVQVLIDKLHFHTILSNLTENAVKYSTDKKVIEYQLSSSKNYVYLSITDHGIGIPKKAQKSIFNKFYRVEDSDSLSSKVKGHGLGLSIVENLVELNNGKVEVQSSSGKGATFIVRFPKLDTDKAKGDQQLTVKPSSASSNINSKEW